VRQTLQYANGEGKPSLSMEQFSGVVYTAGRTAHVRAVINTKTFFLTYGTHSRGSIPLQWRAVQFWVNQIQALHHNKMARAATGMGEDYKTGVSRKIGGLA
jgi:hypothetical protein